MSSANGGAWVLFIQALVFVGAMKFSRSFARAWDILPVNPGDDPPWYFIRHHFIAGLTSGGALIFCLLLAWIVRRRYPMDAPTLVFFPILWMGGEFWGSVVIWFSTDHLFDPARATTRWATFEQFLNDPIIDYGRWAILLGSGMAFIAVTIKTQKSILRLQPPISN